MSKKEEKCWRGVYLFLNLLNYGIVAPLSFNLFFAGEESFPFFIIPVSRASGAMKHKQIQNIREKEEIKV